MPAAEACDGASRSARQAGGEKKNGGTPLAPWSVDTLRLQGYLPFPFFPKIRIFLENLWLNPRNKLRCFFLFFLRTERWLTQMEMESTPPEGTGSVESVDFPIVGWLQIKPTREQGLGGVRRKQIPHDSCVHAPCQYISLAT